jgi:DNA polymerase-3 subunit beta
MEFNIDREILLDGVQKTLSIVEKRTTMPILNNVLIRAGDKGIGIVATNREIGLVAQYDAQVTAKGEITLSARKLFEMIREIQGEAIHFKMNDANWVSISCGKVSYRIPGISADDYPKVEEGEKLKFVTIKSDIFGEMINKTFFAMSTEEMRINLNGVLFEVEKSEKGINVRMVATDGHRLSLVDMDLGDQEFLQLGKGIIIPRRGVSEIRRMVDDGDEDVAIGVEKGLMILKKNNTILKISLIEADYPDYKRVIAMEKGTAITLNRDQFLHALRRMGVMASDKYNGVRIRIGSGKMFLNSTNPDVGEANEELDISGSDKGMEAVYNVRYLIDAVEVVDDEEVVFEMREGLRPGTIRPSGKDNYLCIIMPLKM